MMLWKVIQNQKSNNSLDKVCRLVLFHAQISKQLQKCLVDIYQVFLDKFCSRLWGFC